jgi:hypothetical protein
LIYIHELTHAFWLTEKYGIVAGAVTPYGPEAIHVFFDGSNAG